MIKIMRHVLWFMAAAVWVGAGGSVPTTVWAATASVGEIRTVTGIVSLKSAEGKNRFAAEGSKLFVGDVVTTEKDSTVVLGFVDTSQIALRPSTRFVVQDFQFKAEKPTEDSAQFKLVKGGMRTLTGLIGKRGNADAYRLQSETATIGIRGTDYSARICKGDCNDDAKNTDKPSNTNATTADVAGRVSLIDGDARVTSDKGKVRQLVKGSGVFAGDTIDVSDQATVTLAMADNTRLTLPGGTKFAIPLFKYIPSAPESSFASFKLLKGAVRSVTGAIGKAKPENVSYATPTATVGIRGTAFDLACTSTVNGDVVLVVCSGGSSVAVNMRDGQVTLTTPLGTLNVVAGQTAVIANAQSLPVLSTTPINLFRSLTTQPPLPESTPANFDQLSSTPTTTASGPQSSNTSAPADPNAPPPITEETLFVAVNDGTVVVGNADRQITVNRGEGAVIQTQTQLPPRLLVAPPLILQRDTSLSAPAFSAPQCN